MQFYEVPPCISHPHQAVPQHPLPQSSPEAYHSDGPSTHYSATHQTGTPYHVSHLHPLPFPHLHHHSFPMSDPNAAIGLGLSTGDSLGLLRPRDSSRGVSPVDSNSESSATSPSESTSTTTGKRRTRASKPKVRTGCITWIRRVKCGEEKPKCLRCTGTGRKCDGYDSTLAPSRALSSMRAEENQRGIELARQEFLRAYQWNAAMKSLRPIVADIDGTEAERRFFHGFRAIAAASEQGGLGLASHVSNSNSFWSRVAPQLAHRDGAVKHAMVALGSAYQLYQQSPDGSWSSGGGSSRKSSLTSSPGDESQDLEIFTIQQINKSISLLQSHAASSSPESVLPTLVCCLAFICLENLRNDEAAALTHLTNGIRILDMLPSETFAFLASDVELSGLTSRGRGLSPATTPQPTSRMPSTSPAHGQGSAGPQPTAQPMASQHESHDMRTIIRMFCRLECSAAFFAAGTRPSLALRAYALRRFDDGSASLPPLTHGFESLAEAHSHCSGHYRDVVARLHETNSHGADATFWADPYQRRQQQALRARSRRLRALLQQFANSPTAPRPDTPELYSLRIDMLHFLATTLLLDGMTGLEETDEDMLANPGGNSMSLGLGQDMGLGMGLGMGVGMGMGMAMRMGGAMGMPTGDMGMGVGVGMDVNMMNLGTCLGTGISSPIGPSNPRSQALLTEMLALANSMAQTARKIRGQRSTSVVILDDGSTASTNAVYLGSSTTPSPPSMAPNFRRGFTYDGGIVGPLYLVAISADDQAVRQRALRALQDSPAREGFWDGPSLANLVQRVGVQISRGRWPFQDVPRSLSGLGGIPNMWETLVRLEMEDAGDALM